MTKTFYFANFFFFFRTKCVFFISRDKKCTHLVGTGVKSCWKMQSAVLSTMGNMKSLGFPSIPRGSNHLMDNFIRPKFSW